MSNSRKITLPSNIQVFILAHTNSSMEQCIRITGPDPDPVSAQFKGSGENKSMHLDSSAPDFIKTDGGWLYFQTQGQGETCDYTVEFTVQGEEPSTSQVHVNDSRATVGGPRTSGYATIMVASEDSTDRDYNDCLLLFVFFEPR